jgi:TonB family protein
MLLSLAALVPMRMDRSFALVSGFQNIAIVNRLPTPSYPPMALAAHVEGDVELSLSLRSDGTIQSTAVIGGPPMLRQAALELAQQTGFECQACGASTPIRVIIRFVLGEMRPCSDEEGHLAAPLANDPYLQATLSGNTITMMDRPHGTCDPASTISRNPARSAKCLFLWKCGWR